MALTNKGREFIASKIIGASGAAFDATNARIGVGNSTTAFSVAQTDLQGASKFRAPMYTGFPTVAGNKITFKSLFEPNQANFAWNEWGLFNAASGGVMLNRVVEYNGTKLAGQTWIFEVEITIE